MNIPIVNPIWFYVINICDVIKMLSMIASCFLLGIFIVATLEKNNVLTDEKDYKSIVISTIIALSLSVFIPSKDTAYLMLIASKITPANIQIAEESNENIIDYIIEKIDEMQANKG